MAIPWPVVDFLPVNQGCIPALLFSFRDAKKSGRPIALRKVAYYNLFSRRVEPQDVVVPGGGLEPFDEGKT
jgi:hypothetical protein